MDNIIIGAILGTTFTLMLQKPKQPDMKVRAKACSMLERSYPMGKFTPAMYSVCLEYGAEATLDYYQHTLK